VMPGKPSLLACDVVAQGTAQVRACSKLIAASGMGAIGTACTSDDACRGGLCLDGPDGKKECSDACCTDADCADPAFVCRPHQEGASFDLRCAR
jgi:hypothetical protein